MDKSKLVVGKWYVVTGQGPLLYKGSTALDFGGYKAIREVDREYLDRFIVEATVRGIDVAYAEEAYEQLDGVDEWVWALFGYEDRNPAMVVAAVYAKRCGNLPIGGWAAQGMREEIVRLNSRTHAGARQYINHSKKHPEAS